MFAVSLVWVAVHMLHIVSRKYYPNGVAYVSESFKQIVKYTLNMLKPRHDFLFVLCLCIAPNVSNALFIIDQ